MFISFEGIEGAGKSTAMSLLAEALRLRGHDVVETREPGGCNLGRLLRPILLDARTDGLSSRAELFLFLADRAQHVHSQIRPALEAAFAADTVACVNVMVNSEIVSPASIALGQLGAYKITD